VMGAVGAWITMAELLQRLQQKSEVNYNKPLLVLYVIHSAYAIYIPICFVWILIKKIMKPKQTTILSELSQGMSLKRKLLVAFCINPVMLACAYTWYLSLPLTRVSANTGIYNSASVFVYLFSIFLLKERVAVIKVASVIICIGGVVLMGIIQSRTDDTHNTSVLGYIFVIVSTFLYALYEVLYKKFAITDASSASCFNTMLFLGLTGTFSLLLFWPSLFIWNALHWEIFEFPPNPIIVQLVLNGALDCVFNILLLLAIMMTSPLFVSVGSLLTVPASIVADKIFHSYLQPPFSFVGGGLIVLGFIGMNISEYLSEKDQRQQTAFSKKWKQRRMF